MGILSDMSKRIDINPYTGYEYDYNRGRDGIDGFSKKQTAQGTKKVEIITKVSDELVNEIPLATLENEIKHQIASKLVDELLKGNFIEIRKRPKDHSDPLAAVEFKGSVMVADIRHTNVMVEENCMFYGGKEWSEQEILAALKYTHPEYAV